jgi:hypothetical protein
MAVGIDNIPAEMLKDIGQQLRNTVMVAFDAAEDEAKVIDRLMDGDWPGIAEDTVTAVIHAVCMAIITVAPLRPERAQAN